MVMQNYSIFAEKHKTVSGKCDNFCYLLFEVHLILNLPTVRDIPKLLRNVSNKTNAIKT